MLRPATGPIVVAQRHGIQPFDLAPAAMRAALAPAWATAWEAARPGWFAAKEGHYHASQ